VLRSAEGEAVATALMVIGDGIVITGNVITDPSRRRMGYGAAMMRTGLAWAKSAGATVAALNVAADNPAAQSLYRSLGYERQYDYAYRVPGAA
jgi:ribosomal protein S18 acetylase RimI-like enzyme